VDWAPLGFPSLGGSSKSGIGFQTAFQLQAPKLVRLESSRASFECSFRSIAFQCSRIHSLLARPLLAYVRPLQMPASRSAGRRSRCPECFAGNGRNSFCHPAPSGISKRVHLVPTSMNIDEDDDPKIQKVAITSGIRVLGSLGARSLALSQMFANHGQRDFLPFSRMKAI
jgi:hypothetical protein